MTMTRISEQTRHNGPNPATKIIGADWGSVSRRRYRPNRPHVDDEGALAIPAFFRGLSVIATTIASLPFDVFRKNEDGTTSIDNSPETYYLWGDPNDEQGRQSMWERVAADEVRQKGIIYVDKREDNDQPRGIWHIDRRRVRVGRASNEQRVYLVDGDIAMVDYKDGGEIVFIPSFGSGLDGYDIIELFQTGLGLSKSSEEYAAESLDNGQIPPGIISTDRDLTRAQADALLAEWRRRHAGIRRGQDVAFLGNGANFQQIAIDHEKMQMRALREFQLQEVGRMLGLPNHLLGDTNHASQGGGAGMEEAGLNLIRFTLLAHILRLEQAIDQNLLVRQLTGRYCKFNVGGLMRASMEARYRAYALAWGRFMTADEIRELEDMEPLKGGAGELLAPVNMIPVDDLATNAPANQKQLPAGPGGQPGEPDGGRDAGGERG